MAAGSMTFPGWRLVVAAQNHDQVGNRAAGERFSHLLSIGRRGEEWAASAISRCHRPRGRDSGCAGVGGRRTEFATFGWDPSSVLDPQSVETFERSRLRWNELSAPVHADLSSWYQALIALRQKAPLRDGKYREVR
jgi:maltooligosyltrehalose trehalohydrolase